MSNEELEALLRENGLEAQVTDETRETLLAVATLLELYPDELGVLYYRERRERLVMFLETEVRACAGGTSGCPAGRCRLD